MVMRIANWRHHYDLLSASPQELYQSIVEELEARDIPGLRIDRVFHREGGFLSRKRLYLQIQRQEYRFKVSATPFSQGVIVSWYLEERLSFWWRLAFTSRTVGMILIRLIRPDSFSRLDRAWAFQTLVHSAILDAVTDHTDAKGYRALLEDEDTPVLSDFFKGDF